MTDTAKKICDDIGRKIISKKIGVNPTAVSNAVVDNLFPASWYNELEKLCIIKGIGCPRGLFNFKKNPPTLGDKQ